MILGKNAQNVQKITDLIKENPRTTLLELEQDTGISKTTIGRIVTKDLKLKKTPAKFIPRFLTNEQKLCRLATCENMLEMTKTDPEWKDKIITGDETWVYDYDPETKRQYAEWRGQDLKLAEFLLKMILGKNAQNVQKITDLIKENPRTTLLELEQDTGISKTTIGRIVTKDLKLKKTPAKFIPRFLTNEQKLCRLATCENMLEMTKTDPEWKDKIITGDETWVYDYDPETKRQYAEWRGQDIAPNDFFLFPKLKAVLKGRHFDTRDDIIEKSLLALKSIPKELYKNCFDNLGETMAL
ncbi:hypothetical protein LAZ67_16001563, partial [Cordylochernes scorpioides]